MPARAPFIGRCTARPLPRPGSHDLSLLEARLENLSQVVAELAAEVGEAKRKLLAAASSIRNTKSRKAFNSWLDASAERAVMYRALSIFTKRSLSAGFATWQHPVW